MPGRRGVPAAQVDVVAQQQEEAAARRGKLKLTTGKSKINFPCSKIPPQGSAARLPGQPIMESLSSGL